MWACDWIIDRREPGIPQGGEREGHAPGSEMINREGKREMFVGGLCGNVGLGNQGCRQLTEAGTGRKREWGNRREGRGELERELAEVVTEKFAGMRLVGKLEQGWRGRFVEGKFGGRRMDGRWRRGGPEAAATA